MRYFVIAGLAVSTLCNSYAIADTSAAFKECTRKSGGVTSDLVNCSGEEFKKQDIKLNIAYKHAMSVLPATQKQKLQDAQRLWVKYRDANCGVYYSLTGGTMDLLNGAGCELQMTQDRASALEWFAENGG